MYFLNKRKDYIPKCEYGKANKVPKLFFIKINFLISEFRISIMTGGLTRAIVMEGGINHAGD